MDKRFTDTEKWNDPWFCGLTIELKLLWLFLVDNCDNAGVWKCNYKLAEFVIGAPIDWKAAKAALNGRLIEVGKGGEYWFIPKYLAFHYPNGLSWDSNFTKGVILKLSGHQLLKKVQELHGKTFIRVSQDLINSRPTPQNKNKNNTDTVCKYIDVFAELWEQYPRKEDKSMALRYFSATVKTDEDVAKVKVALANYLEYIKDKDSQYIKMAKTWFHNWVDWVDYKHDDPGKPRYLREEL